MTANGEDSEAGAPNGVAGAAARGLERSLWLVANGVHAVAIRPLKRRPLAPPEEDSVVSARCDGNPQRPLDISIADWATAQTERGMVLPRIPVRGVLQSATEQDRAPGGPPFVDPKGVKQWSGRDRLGGSKRLQLRRLYYGCNFDVSITEVVS